MNFLGSLIYGYRYVTSLGATLAQRSYLNFTGSGVVVTDNAATGATDVTIGQGAVTETVTTTDVIAGTFTPVAIPDNSQVAVEFYVVMKKPATTTCAFFAKRATYYRSGAGPVLITATTLESDAGGTVWTATLAIVGNTIVPTVTGQSSTIVKSVGQVKYLPVTDT